ncbi:OadG family protein [Alkalimarinus coralli]|uniref:OadG family protein n=1 Tax=Alkalimarinus coralli TaxID=2935863 RepID=UPI00202AC504|nr:OadG family protein [Alkalimarinus coralli]
MTESLMSQAFELMAVGMGFVFVFLIVLIGATTIMSKLAMKLEPPAPEVPLAPAQPQPATPMNDPRLMAIISAAVAKYRSRP